MIMDQQGLFSDAQSLVGNNVTIVSTHVIDTGERMVPKHAAAAFAHDLGKAIKVPLRVQITADVVGGTSIAAVVQTSATEGFASPKEVLRSGAVEVADLAAGFVFPIDSFPLGTDQRYVRLAYVVVGNVTAGQVTAGTVAANEQWFV